VLTGQLKATLLCAVRTWRCRLDEDENTASQIVHGYLFFVSDVDDEDDDDDDGDAAFEDRFIVSENSER